MVQFRQRTTNILLSANYVIINVTVLAVTVRPIRVHDKACNQHMSDYSLFNLELHSNLKAKSPI